MSSSLANLFCKRLSCPSSQTLLAYHQRRLGFPQDGRTETHLHKCDFCSAELQLLTRHCDNREENSSPEMPLQLKRLAESLLRRSVASFRAFPRLERNYKG